MQFQRQSGDVHPATGPVIHWIAVRDTTPIDDDQATFCNRDVLYIKVTVTEHLSIQQTI